MRDAALAADRRGRPTSTSSSGSALEHAGDRSPLALANREIGALPPQARKERRQARRPGPRRGQRGAGRPAGRARGRARGADAGRGGRRRHAALGPRPAGRPAPADHPPGAASPTCSSAMGWEVAEGPEVEAEWLNFDALNLGPDHPARTMQDTFWVEPADGGLVLRTHTSPVQVRTMLSREPPIYVVCPGRVFRTDELDATHTPVFSPGRGPGRRQGHHDGAPEGHPGPLRRRRCSATASTTRLRPSYFPFTEPSRRDRPASASSAAGEPGRGDLPHLQGRGLDRVGRLRHGQPAGAGRLRHRPRDATPASRSAWASSGP